MKMKTLSELEQEAMNIVWKLEKCSVRDVADKLKLYAHVNEILIKSSSF